MNNNRIVPITRVNKFFSEEDYLFDVQSSREVLEGDGNFTVILYRVNRETSEFDNLYGEATKHGIRYFPPIELKVVPIISLAENKTYNKNGSGRYLQDGNLSFGIYAEQLLELNTEVSYGDYIGYPISEKEIRYFSVADDGKKYFDNKHTILGYKGAYRTIKCAPVDESEFSGI
jgi:hypothetical protein